ncbi:MAG: PBSX family phage terminase large subunit [Elusimicrobiota bacterium]|nr:PBSX family phage terminase large subunit [Elusimicrobiota bacterium]
MIVIDVYYTNIFERLKDAEKKFIICIGGAGSSKSYSMCQLFFYFLTQEKEQKLLVLRKTRHSLKLSTYKMFLDMLEQLHCYNPVWHNKSDLEYHYPHTKSRIQFLGLDNYEKIKSTEWNQIWVEEANEITKEEFLFLRTRLSRKKEGEKSKKKSRIYLTLNPVNCWVRDYENDEDFEFIWSNYKDNPFLSNEYIETLESLKKENEDLYNIYALGRWAEIKDLIYKPFKFSEYPISSDDVFYGVDFGYNNPCVLLEVKMKDNNFFVKELIYQTNLTNFDFIELLRQHIKIRTRPIYCDPSEPARIEEIKKAGFNAIPANNDVKSGIDFLKSLNDRIFSNQDNINLNKEIKTYSWKKDKDGKLLDEPIKFNDHCLDALRYAIYTHCHKYLQVGREKIEKTKYEIYSYSSLLTDMR